MKQRHPMPRPLLYGLCAALLAVTASTTVPALRRHFASEAPVTQAQANHVLLEARPFQLQESYVSYNRAEQPAVRSGWALVLRVPPYMAELRNGLMPVLCVGEQTAERWNSGGPSGQIIVTLPCEFDESGQPLIDLFDAPIWFGPVELPERVDSAWLARERKQAAQDHIEALPRAQIDQALKRGGQTLRVKDHSALAQALSHWIESYSPEEAEYAQSLR